MSLVNTPSHQPVVRPVNGNQRGVIGSVVGDSTRMDIERDAAGGRGRKGGGGGGGGRNSSSGRGRKGGRVGGGGPAHSDHQSGSRYTPLSGNGRHDPLSSSSRNRRPQATDSRSSRSDKNTTTANNGAAPAGDAGLHVRTIKEWLATRVRGPGILDLHSMVTDPLLVAPGIRMPGHPSAKGLHGEVFWKCIAEQDPHTHTLRLSHNDLTDLKTLAGLPKWLPHIRALDLSDNLDLSKVSMLDVLSTLSCVPTGKDGNKLGLYNLHELRLTNTKIRREFEREGRLTAYLREILARFPNLTMLDEELVPRISFPVSVDYPIKAIPATEMQEIRSKPFVWPFDVKGNFVETPVLETFATTFLAKFFAAFDSSRSSLLPVYAPQATLSHNFTYTIPRRRVKSEVTVAPGKTSWDHWNPTNRNLIRIGKPRRTNTLVVSDERSLTAWLLNTIPATKHPLDDPTKWMYDVLPLDAVGGVGRIMLTIHGEFVEEEKQLHRSFSRNIILSETQPGTPAAAAGWPGVILSDTLSVRPTCDISNFTKSLAVAGAQIVPRNLAPPPDGVPADIAARTDLSPEQMLVVVQVQARTNLVTPMAIDCAQTAGFNLDMALAKFQELQPQIPAHFFREGGA